MAAAPLPTLAPQPTPEGTVFRVVSRRARGLELHLYDAADDRTPARTIRLDPERHRRGDVWEVRVPDAGPGQLYAWGTDAAPGAALLDPCALLVAGPERFGVDHPERLAEPRSHDGNRDARFKSVVVAPDPRPDWERPRTPWKDSVVYELHVRGFTRASDDHDAPGTYRALIDRIPYLVDLGVTAIELLPVHEFDEMEPRPGQGSTTDLVNFWGYNPVAMFAPMRRYAASATEIEGPLREFREMVLAMHRAGIQVILDVVFNHTAEMREDGPVWSFRGLDDQLYYLRNDGGYADLTGCGNTLRLQHPALRRLVLDALRWWVHGMGVDGFRFDLASILARDEDGALLRKPPLVREIEEDPWLRGVHLVAEAWDAAGGYLVSRWPGGPRWAVWNDRFRDEIRRAWFEGHHLEGVLASRLSGSSDLFGGAGGPTRGVNYVCCHDGFTLADVCSYSRKHNQANGEGGRDGRDHEPSHNHGEEGPTEDPGIRRARERTRRNLVASLLLAQGVPMILAGDEIGRTQHGNNNAYCHDAPLAWVDWARAEAEAPFRRFVRGLVRLRRERASLRRERFLQGPSGDGAPDIRWIGVSGGPIHWESEREAFGYRLSGAAERTGADDDEPDLLVLLNLGEDARTFRLVQGRWRVVAATAADPPGDFHEPGEGPVPDGEYELPGRSLAVLTAEG